MNTDYLISYCYGSGGHFIGNMIVAFEGREIGEIYSDGRMHNQKGRSSRYVESSSSLDYILQADYRHIIPVHFNNAIELEQATGRTVITITYDIVNVSILYKLHKEKYTKKDFPYDIYIDWYNTVVPSDKLLRFEWIYKDHKMLLATLSKILNLPINDSARNLLQKYNDINLQLYPFLNEIIYSEGCASEI